MLPRGRQGISNLDSTTTKTDEEEFFLSHSNYNKYLTLFAKAFLEGELESLHKVKIDRRFSWQVEGR